MYLGYILNKFDACNELRFTDIWTFETDETSNYYLWIECIFLCA